MKTKKNSLLEIGIGFFNFCPKIEHTSFMSVQVMENNLLDVKIPDIFREVWQP